MPAEVRKDRSDSAQLIIPCWNAGPMDGGFTACKPDFAHDRLVCPCKDAMPWCVARSWVVGQ